MCTASPAWWMGMRVFKSSQQPALSEAALLDATRHVVGDMPGNSKPDAAPAPSADLVVWHAGIEVLSAAETLEAAAALDGRLDDDEGSQCPVCNVAGLAEARCCGLLALHAGLIGRVRGQGVSLQQEWVGDLSRSQAAAEVSL